MPRRPTRKAAPPPPSLLAPPGMAWAVHPGIPEPQLISARALGTSSAGQWRPVTSEPVAGDDTTPDTPDTEGHDS